MGDAFLPELLVGVDDDLGIRACLEPMPLLLQSGADLGEIVDLAIEDYLDRPRFVGDRLLSRLEIDDPEAAMAKCHRSRHVKALIVRPSVAQLCRHPPDDIGVSPLIGKREEAANTAHRLSFGPGQGSRYPTSGTLR